MCDTFLEETGSHSSWCASNERGARDRDGPVGTGQHGRCGEQVTRNVDSLVVARTADDGVVATTARPKVTAQEVARGRALFEAQCAYCHGADGDGGRGANLARPALRRAPTDEALFRVVNRGIPGTGMPGNAMSARETWQVVAFVRSLGRVKREPLPGDAARGAQVYEALAAQRATPSVAAAVPLGPDLTDIGARSSPAFLRRVARRSAGRRAELVSCKSGP